MKHQKLILPTGTTMATHAERLQELFIAWLTLASKSLEPHT